MAARRSSRNSVALDADLNDRRVRGGPLRTVLLLGEMSPSLRSELVLRGADVTICARLGDAFPVLAERDFDAVAINPLTDGAALDFVSVIKEGEIEHELTIATLYGARGSATFMKWIRPPSLESLKAVRLKHRMTPFVMLPLANEWRYAVIVQPPLVSGMRDLRKQSVATTLLTFDVSELLNQSEPMA